MGIGFFIGLALIAGAGFIQGRTIVPMKYAPRCRWENVWLSLPYLRSCYRPSGLCFSVPLNPEGIVSCRFGAYPVECFPHWPGLGIWYDARGNWLHNAGDGPRSFDRFGIDSVGGFVASSIATLPRSARKWLLTCALRCCCSDAYGVSHQCQSRRTTAVNTLTGGDSFEGGHYGLW